MFNFIKMTSYEQTINELEKQVNDFSKYIKPENIVVSKNNDSSLNMSNISSKLSSDHLKYIIIPVGIFIILVLSKPSFVTVETIVDDNKVQKISYVRILIITIVISLIIYFILKNKNSLLNKK
jgi:hypothetical protein